MSRQRGRNALRQAKGARNCSVGTTGVESPKINRGELSPTGGGRRDFNERHENPDFPRPHRPHQATETRRYIARKNSRLKLEGRGCFGYRSQRPPRLEEDAGAAGFGPACDRAAPSPAAPELPQSSAGLPSSRLRAQL